MNVMELYEEIVMQEIRIALRGMAWSEEERENLIHQRCYKLLAEIREVVRDDRLDDEECFRKIEHIVCLLEDAGVDCGTRHDYG